MKTVDVIRRENLHVLAKESGGAGTLADDLGKSKSQVSQWLNASPDSKTGKPRTIGNASAREIEQKKNKPTGWMDVDHSASDVVEPAALTSPAPVQGVGAQPNPPHERDYALIPQYHVSGECGSGYLNGHEEVKGGLAFKRDWLARMSLKPDSLSVIYACGLSMAPTINEGEVLLVDHDQCEPRDGQVFAFERDGELLIKRLVRHPAGSWICRSDNPDKIRYADWEPVSTEQLGLLRIVGRIVWRGGAM